MLSDFLNFLNLNNKATSKKTITINKNNEEQEVIQSEQVYKIEEKIIIKSNNEKAKQIIEIIPIGNGKALKRVQTQTIGR